MVERVAGASSELSLEPYAPDGTMLGVDLGIGLGEAHGAEVLCRVAFALAAERALEVFDPQLGRIVGEGEGSLIKQQFAEMGAFSEAAPLAAASLPGQGLSRSSRMWLVVLGGAALLVLLSRVVTCLS